MSDTKDSGIDFVRREYRDAYLAIREEAFEDAQQVALNYVGQYGHVNKSVEFNVASNIAAAIRALKDKPCVVRTAII